ncbi:MAG: hypothetical protein MHPDNHAH_00488 [Anaerolineales bacterium]|nr:hypothetical protein [Anaerolineales bacterium]
MMNQTYAKCGKNEMLTGLPLYDGMNRMPYTAVREAKSENPRKPGVTQTMLATNIFGASPLPK